MPSRIWLPSSLAAPVNGAEMPNRTSLSVTPRMAGALAFAPPTDATRAGIPPGGCAPAVAIVTPGAGGAPLGGCGPVDGIEGPAAGAAPVSDGLVDAIGTPAGGLTCASGFGVSGLDVRSVVVVPNPINLRHVVPSAKYIPIAAPISTAMMSPPMDNSHPGLQGRERDIAELERPNQVSKTLCRRGTRAHSRQLALRAGPELLCWLTEPPPVFARILNAQSCLRGYSWTSTHQRSSTLSFGNVASFASLFARASPRHSHLYYVGALDTMPVFRAHSATQR